LYFGNKRTKKYFWIVINLPMLFTSLLISSLHFLIRTKHSQKCFPSKEAFPPKKTRLTRDCLLRTVV
jgi:hypothetical protein